MEITIGVAIADKLKATIGRLSRINHGTALGDFVIYKFFPFSSGIIYLFEETHPGVIVEESLQSVGDVNIKGPAFA